MNNNWGYQTYWHPSWQWYRGYNNYQYPYYPEPSIANQNDCRYYCPGNTYMPFENDKYNWVNQGNDNGLLNDVQKRSKGEIEDNEVGDQPIEIETASETNQKISIDEAINIAREKTPGEVVKAELNTQNPVWVYKIDVITSENNRDKIEVDANTGNIAELLIQDSEAH